MYIYQRENWPNFGWNAAEISELLASVRFSQGQLLGAMKAQGFSVQKETSWKTVIQDVMHSSEIEGEILPLEQVRSSVARRLGIEQAGILPTDRNVDGLVEMMLDATQRAEQPLTADRLFDWHAAMFPTGRSGMLKIVTGKWRVHTEDDPMQVVSGAMGKEKVHFQTPPAEVIAKEMQQFLDWVAAATQKDPVIKAAIAHLWFLTIHPFDDGNGRIARAVTDLLLARADQTPQRFYSMSSAILTNRKSYYATLEKCQKGTLDITAWLTWFLQTLKEAILNATKTLDKVLVAVRFWQTHETTALNERQRKIIKRLLGEFKGKLTSTKYAKMTRVSQDTASRDINDLVDKNILTKGESSGRSTHYKLLFLLLILLLPACRPNAQPTETTTKKEPTEQVIHPINEEGNTIVTRFKPPAGFSRPEVANESFAGYLRNFPLQPTGTHVHLYNGQLKARQDVHLAVLDIDVDKRDLQQCADAVMRLRAEYLWQHERYAEISFNFTSGFPAEYQQWRNGKRIRVNGNKVNWTNGTTADVSYKSFRRYLVQVFAYAGTLSLEQQLKKKPLENIEIGDVLIQGGSPGHAVIVVDKAVNSASGEVAVMLAQSYMPAQEIHVLRNPGQSGESPWYFISLDSAVPGEAMNAKIATPEWDFTASDLKSF